MEKKENGSLPHTTYKNQLQKDKEPKKPDTQLCWQRSSSQSYGFSSSHVRMWELDHKEGWAPKNWCFQTVVLEKTLRVHWTARRSNQSILKETSTEYSLEGLMLKLKLQYCGHLMWRVDSLKKTDAGRDWGQEEKGTTEDDMARWHHWFDGLQFEWTPEVGDGQGGLACCNSWGRKESDRTEGLIWSDLIWSAC